MNLEDFVTMSPKKHTILRLMVVGTFSTLSVAIFLYLNGVQPYYYIDEIFHIPQTLRYCNGKYFEWDQKITTFPGLYLIATVILAPFGLCNTMCLRGINLFATFLNFHIVHEILKVTRKFEGKKGKDKNIQKKKWINLLTSLNVALLPPLYFLLFIFYTDVVSTNMVLFMYVFYLNGKIKTSAFMGVVALMLRQTNIIWVAWVCLEIVMDIIENKKPDRIHRRLKNTPAHIRLLWDNAKEEFQQSGFCKFAMEIFCSLFFYVVIGLAFMIFVVWNKGIVLGDRSAHVATIHLPQIFYASVFFCFFAWPYFVPYVKDYLRLLKRRWFLASLVFILMGMIVHWNTLVHPYLLADNRHYTFYVWNKIIRRYDLARYLFVPFYGFCLYCIWRGLYHFRFLSQIGYFMAVSLVLVPQLLVEPRYFFIPYIIFRVNITHKILPWQIVAETCTIFLVNVFQFYVFVNKVFYWANNDHPQRISW